MTPTRFALVVPLLVHAAAAFPQTIRDLVGERFEARIIAVSDGDTVDARPVGEPRGIRVRLEGVDAPERGEPFSDQARAFTRVMLFDRQVSIEGRAVDRYGRLVARVRLAGDDASTRLVRAGLACHYVFFSSDPGLATAEAEARAAGRGFWATAAPRPRCALRSSADRPSGPVGPQNGAPLQGNTASRVYHRATCRNARCSNCTRGFASEADARAAGFRPAGDCFGKQPEHEY